MTKAEYVFEKYAASPKAIYKFTRDFVKSIKIKELPSDTWNLPRNAKRLKDSKALGSEWIDFLNQSPFPPAMKAKLRAAGMEKVVFPFLRGLILPTAVGGAAVGGYYIGKDKKKKAELQKNTKDLINYIGAKKGLIKKEI